MKVLHLLASNKYSGAENVVCQIINMFDKDVDMVYCSPNGDISSTLNDKSIKFLPLNEFSFKELKRVVKEFKPDVIHAHDVKASILASRFFKQCKIISHIHGNDKKNMGKITLKSLIYNFYSKRFKKIFWVSNSCIDDYYFKKSVVGKSKVLHNIISIQKLYDLVEMDANNYNFDICYLGRLTDVKNPLRALKIMKQVIEQNQEVKCAVVGDGNLREECENFVKTNKLENNIKIFGFMKNPYKILQSSKVILMSSINEGTPMAILEAFALGVPLVSTKVDGAVELINNDLMGGLYNDDNDAKEMIINILKGNTQERQNYLKSFSIEYNDIEKYKKEIFKAYED